MSILMTVTTKLKKGIHYLRSSIARSNGKTFSLQKIDSCRQRGQYKEAMQLLEKSLTDNSQDIQLLKLPANLKSQMKDDEGVVQLLEKAAALEPLGDDTSRLYGQAKRRLIQSEIGDLRSAGKFDKLIDVLEDAIAICPTNVALLKDLANTKFRIFDLHGTIDTLNKVHAIEPLEEDTKKLYAATVSQLSSKLLYSCFLEPELCDSTIFDKVKSLHKQAHDVFGIKSEGQFGVEYTTKLKPTDSNRGPNNDLITQMLSNSLDPFTRILNDNNDHQLDVNARAELISIIRLISEAGKGAEVEAKEVRPIPKEWPKGMRLNPLPESTNDYNWYLKYRDTYQVPQKSVALSVIVPTYNRSHILSITLACLANQKTDYIYEVIVADDGSNQSIEKVVRRYEDKLDIKYVRQKDYGYQLCAIRNLGMRAAKHDYVAILDCDMAPDEYWLDSFMRELITCDDIAYIGPRKYIDTEHLSDDQVLRDPSVIASQPEVLTNDKTSNTVENNVTLDWRLKHFEDTENLRLCNTPFRYFSGGNVAFAKKWLSKAGWFDEEFTHWGGEDNEFGYRLYRSGCFFKSVNGAMAYHQEPPGKENETDRSAGKKVTINIVKEKVPYFYRKTEAAETSLIRKVPLVSIYIPAYNCEDSIVRCVNSALYQTITDLEVCICDDGSTDNTLEVIRQNFGGNPRVRWISTSNRGIGAASNAAVSLAKGYYIGQLDSDDYLATDAVESCLSAFMSNRKLACVYTTYRNVDSQGDTLTNGYNWPHYSREKLTVSMICHHFRMFTARAFALTSGFNEEIENAVDYDIYLKLSEIGPFEHINKICYNRMLHGENTSIKKLSEQKENHFRVVNDALKRQSVANYRYVMKTTNNACREYILMKQKKYVQDSRNTRISN